MVLFLIGFGERLGDPGHAARALFRGIHFRVGVHDGGGLTVLHGDNLAILGGVIAIRGGIAVTFFIRDVDGIALLQVLVLVIPLQFALVGLHGLHGCGGFLRLGGCHFGLRVADFAHLAVHHHDGLAVLGHILAIGSGHSVTFRILNENGIPGLQVFFTIPGENALVGRDVAQVDDSLRKPGQ